MPVITGNQITLRIKETADPTDPYVTYTPQVTSVTLNYAANQDVFESLAGPVYKTTIVEFTLDVDMLLDWGTTGGICEALEAAFDSDPDGSIDFELKAIDANTVTVTGKVFPKTPPAGGTGATVTTGTVSFVGDVNTGLNIASAPTP
jgi:hypothetical protein